MSSRLCSTTERKLHFKKVTSQVKRRQKEPRWFLFFNSQASARVWEGIGT